MTTADLTFSVVVNTVNRAGPLGTLLRALEGQSYPGFEVVVVVGPVTDNTLEVLSEYQGRVRVLRCPTANLSRSRNIGLLAAQGDIVAYIDDDAVPCRRWLEQLNRLFANPCLDAAGGVVYIVHPRQAQIQHRVGIVSSLSDHTDVRVSMLDGVVPGGVGSQWVPRPMGTNMAYRRRALLQVGGFDEFYVYISEETDLAMRLAQAGMVVHPVKEAAVYHVPASSHNRIVFTQRGRWWRMATRSWTYFSIKNGPPAGDSPRAILRRCLWFPDGHWRAFILLLGRGELTLPQALVMGAGEVFGSLSGAVGGLFRPRQLIPQTAVERGLKETGSILPFQNESSSRQPTIDPVGGSQPAISMPEPPLRICLLSHAYPPAQYDGIGRHTNLMARGLFECGHTVHVIAGGEKEQVAFYDGAYVHRTPYTLDRYARYQGFAELYHSLNNSHAIYDKVRRLVLNDGIQVVDSPLWQFEGLVTAVSGVLPVVVRLQTSLRQVLNMQAATDRAARLLGDLERTLLERAAHAVPNTHATLDNVQTTYGLKIAAGRYTVVPHGIVPVADDQVRPFDPARAAGPLTVLYVGRLEKRKGILDLFQAIPQVLQQVPNAKFVIAGADNSRHDGFQARQGADYPTHFASRYKPFLPSVSFLGAVSDETLQGLYQSCDLFVAPSLYESFGLIYVEAMNYAKPVIGCCAGGVPEVVDDGATGLLVEPEAPAALAEAIVSLLKSPARLREMGLAGREQVLQRFSYIQMARSFEKVYRAVIRDFAAAQQKEARGDA